MSSPAPQKGLRPSPFLGRSPVRDVFVAHGRDPYAVASEALGHIDLTPAAGKRVLLKPNAGRAAAPGSGVTTHPLVVAAAIDAFRAAGAVVAVGESPITGVTAAEAFEATGIAAAARDRGCPLIDLNVRPPVPVAIPRGEAIRALKVCAEVLEFDIVVSIPVAKTHMHTGVTLAVKNMKGCLWRRSKVDLHMLPPVPGRAERSLEIAIADMASVLRPHLALVDATTGMEGLGPSAGQPKALGVVAAGADAFAVDAAVCRLMGRRAEDIPHLRIGAARGYGEIALDRIAVAPAGWMNFASPFERAPENLSIQFPDVTVLDNQSCSACQSTLLLFLQKHGAELRDYFPPGETIHVAIGKGHSELPSGTLCIGNCTSCHREAGVFVAGCPPVGSEILRTLEAKRRR